MDKYRLRITFVTELLGSAPLNAELYTDYVLSKAPAVNGAAPADEVATIQDDVKGRTGFRRAEDGTPVLPDYVLRGFFKEAWRAVRQQRNRLSTKLAAGKSKIDTQLFVFPRFIPLIVTRPKEVTVNERPLRADTAQGPRVALASSEQLPEQTYLDCTIEVLAPDVITEALLREWLDYGKYVGIGQWRNASHGRFEYKLSKVA